MSNTTPCGGQRAIWGSWLSPPTVQGPQDPLKSRDWRGAFSCRRCCSQSHLPTTGNSSMKQTLIKRFLCVLGLWCWLLLSLVTWVGCDIGNLDRESQQLCVQHGQWISIHPLSLQLLGISTKRSNMSKVTQASGAEGNR